jgi:hypothetical protein
MLCFAMERRRRVKEQLLKLDETFSPVQFTYTDLSTQSEKEVLTLEERQYPTLASGATAETGFDEMATSEPKPDGSRAYLGRRRNQDSSRHQERPRTSGGAGSESHEDPGFMRWLTGLR